MLIYLVYKLLTADNAPAKLSMGVLMYAVKAVDSHLPE